MITTYVAHKNAVDEPFKKWLEMGLDYSTMADFTPFKSFFDQFSAMADGEKKTKD